MMPMLRRQVLRIGLEYAVSTLSAKFAPIGQELHPDKCEVMAITEVRCDPPPPVVDSGSTSQCSCHRPATGPCSA